jgi:hypothetical protein
MSNKKKNPNPYRASSIYNSIFAYIQANQIVTLPDLIAEFGSEKKFSVQVVLSPRASDAVRKGADPRGNASAAGHIYFMDKLNVQKDSDGNKLPQRFRLRFRKDVLESIRAENKRLAEEAKAGKVEAEKEADVQEEVQEVQEVQEAEVTEVNTADSAEA